MSWIALGIIRSMKNFWNKLNKPFFALAPMEDVTDTAFRQVVASIGKPDVFFTEFANVDGIFSAGEKKVFPRLKFTSKEHPIVAQIWGAKLENFTKAARLIAEMGFDGIDINMGCPQKSVIKQKACSALINYPEKAKEIFLAVKRGAGDLPVSIKTRIGFDKIQTEEWIGFLLELEPAVLTVHGRTVKEQSEGLAHWDEIGKVVKMRDKLKSKTLIMGNGDVASLDNAREKCQQYGVDGVMIGRGVFHNPWVFNPEVDLNKVTIKDRLKVLEKHLQLFEKSWQGEKDFNILKKFFKAYIRDFDGASELRTKLMEVNNPQEVHNLLQGDALQRTKQL